MMRRIVQGMVLGSTLLGANTVLARAGSSQPLPAAPPHGARPEGRVTQPLREVREQLQARIAKEHIPSVAVAVVRGSDVLWQEAFG